MSQRFAFALRGGLLAAILVLVANVLQAQTVDINGTYRAEGRNPDGSAYSGQATVSQVGNAVEIQWTVGNQRYSGAGVRDGQVVVVNWGQPAPVIYVVMSNGDLYGTWANGTALERLIRR